MKAVRIHAFQRIPAHIVVTIAGRGGKAGCIHTVFLHGGNHFGLVIFRHLINRVKAGAQRGEHILPKAVNLIRYAKLGIDIFIHHAFHPLPFQSD